MMHKQIVTGADAQPKVAEPKVSKVQQQYYDLALAKDPEMPEVNDTTCICEQQEKWLQMKVLQEVMHLLAIS